MEKSGREKLQGQGDGGIGSLWKVAQDGRMKAREEERKMWEGDVGTHERVRRNPHEKRKKEMVVHGRGMGEGNVRETEGGRERRIQEDTTTWGEEEEVEKDLER